MIEIFPSPLSFTGSYNAGTIEASLQAKWPGTIVKLINGTAFASLETTASYSNIESSAFDVEVWNPTTNLYSSTFVYKAGMKAGGAGQFYNYSVWGEGVTGVAPNTYTLWTISSTPELNYLNFGTDEAETKIKVTYNRGNISSIDVGPYSKEFNSKWSRVTGTLNSVEISGIKPNDKLFIQVSSSVGLDASTPLMVFANPPSPVPPTGTYVFYVAPGILQAKAFNYTYSSTGFYPPLSPFTATLDQQIDLKTWGINLVPPNTAVVYLDGGSYIDGTFGCREISGVKIMGRGVIDAYRENDWWESWSYLATGVTDEKKLTYSPFMGFSSFPDGSEAIAKAPNNTLEGITTVNSITYANTVKFVDVSNVKVINHVPNGDFLRVGEPYEFNYRTNRIARITNCFGFVGDDCFFPKDMDCDIIVSSCYVIPIYATVFRSYDGRYNGKAYGQPGYGYSAIDIDARSYASIGYYDKNRPLYSQFKISIFGLWNTQEKEVFGAFDPKLSYYIGDCLFSGIRVEGYCDVPLFDIGIRSYPRTSQDVNSANPFTTDYPEVYGNISGIKFIDITANSHPNSKYKWVYSNAIFGTEPQFKPQDLTFSNVKIDGITITDDNKNQFFAWENKAVPLDSEPTFYTPTNGSSIADLYFLIGDSIAFGVSSFAKDLSATEYSSVISSGVAIPGCYIWRLTQPIGEPTAGPGFFPMKPGISTGEVESPYINPYGDMGLETFLAYKLRNDSGGRDVYFLKLGVGGSMPVSAVSANGYPAENWSISSTNSLFYEFAASATSAVTWLRNQNKYVDLKGGFICLGTNQPEYVANQSFASSMIIKETSSLIAGVRSVFASSTGNGLNVDTFYTKIYWLGSLELGSIDTATRNYSERFNTRLEDLDSSSIRFNYIEAPSNGQYLADSVHYNALGHSKIANTIYSAIQANSSSVTNPSLNFDVNYLFLFQLPEEGFVTNNGVKVDYLWDRGQLHPFVATLHYIQEQAKVMQASAYYDDNREELAASGWWRNLLHNYANTLTESSGAFPNSFDNYTTYKFGRDFQKLYYDYTHNFKRHKAIPTTMELDGPTIFAHTFGSVFYNSDLSKNGSLTNQYPVLITTSLSSLNEFRAGSILFSTSGTTSGTYVASSITDCPVGVTELRNSGILTHIEFTHPSGTSVNNSFAVIRLDKSNRVGYRYNPLTYENTLIKHKGAPGGFSRVIFDISKYPVDSNIGYDISSNFLTPEHDFKLNFKTIIANNKGEIFGGSPVGVWIHTKPELGKIWSFTDEGKWVQHAVSSLTKSEVVDHYSHIFELPTEQRDLTSSSVRCNKFRLIGNNNQENDVIASLSESEFTDIEVNFNTKNYVCRGEKIAVPEEYFSQVAHQVHRLNQKYVIEFFSLDRELDKFTLFYDFNLVDSTLNKWSKPFVLGKGSTGLPVGDLYCTEYRVDLTPRHLYNIIRYFNEIAGGANTFGYASRNATSTSGVYESRGGSRINYVENPNWNPVTTDSSSKLINEINIIN